MRTITDWLTEYGESHTNQTNKLIHWVCVPAIFFSVTALLYSIKLPFAIGGVPVNVAFITIALVIAYYATLSLTLAIGMLLFSSACLFLCYTLEQAAFMPLWLVGVIIFVTAWVGQFYGHKIEGKKPSFLKDIQFLMIGPAWLMSFIYKKIGIQL